MTAEMLRALAAPFAPDLHEFHRGMVYLSEEAIANRLDEVDPSWTWELCGDPVVREGVVSQRGRLTIGGICRDGLGMAAPVLDKSGEREVNEPEKSAATDAFKRAARMFGVGRYLLSTPQTVRDYETLARWLNGGQKPAHQPQRQQPAPAPAPSTNGNGDTLEFTATTCEVKEYSGKRYFVFSDGTNRATTYDTALAGEASQAVAASAAGNTIQINAAIRANLETKKDGGKYYRVAAIEPAGAAVPF